MENNILEYFRKSRITYLERTNLKLKTILTYDSLRQGLSQDFGRGQVNAMENIYIKTKIKNYYI